MTISNKLSNEAKSALRGLLHKTPGTPAYIDAHRRAANVLERLEAQTEVLGEPAESKASQLLQVREFLEAGYSLTPIQALNYFRSLRLSAIIYKLRHDYCLPIETVMVCLPTGKYVAKYYIKPENLKHDK